MATKEELPKCAVPSCDRRVPSPDHEFCAPCAEARRTWQLKVNREKWKERVKQGDAGHRIMYNGMPTKWAMENPVEAVRIALKGDYDDATLKFFIRALGRI
jgi:hypothetical protein